MSEKYKTDSTGLYFVSFSVAGWIDVFTRREYQEILIESIQYCQKNKKSENILLLHHAKPCSFYFVF
ncbi:MAG: hypothetical protein A3F72_12135 [Bacteroidetes bacterium RIFCSPLOWO2_12_FULL_35_15]|nr:MAG: hypothetical protein A3F72_12135 [Bacteroidetes bacterium RIFCSPLOWO2_12_FULL_35_15]